MVLRENRTVEINNKAYHEEQGHFSASRMKNGLNSLADFKNYEPIGHKKYFDIGNAFEIMLCDRANFNRDCVIQDMNMKPEPSKTMASKANKEWNIQFQQENIDKLIITLDEMNMIISMVKAVKAHPMLGEIIEQGVFQKSIFWNDSNGLPVKTRPDIYIPTNDFDTTRNVINVDIKSIFKQGEFKYQMRKLNYPLQAVMQVMGLEAAGLNVVNSFWLVVEKTKNPVAILYSFTNQQINEMREIYNNLSKRIKEAILNNHFPTPEQELENDYRIVELELDEYFKSLNNK